MRTIAYMRVSTEEQARSGLGLEAQRDAIAAEVERREWSLVAEVTDDGISGSTLARPGIAQALEMLTEGEADVLVVAKLDRLSRSLVDFAGVMEEARSDGWSLVALDLGVDMTTPAGEMMAGVMASFAQYERRLIAQRTREALSALRSQGHRFGRPVALPAEIRNRVLAYRRQGYTLAAIADMLTDAGVATAQGGRRWWPSTVRAVLRSLELDADAEALREAAA
jgi:DNA invertase Pin-like site-specific DNA recombinase